MVISLSSLKPAEMSSKRGGTSRVLVKLKKSVEEGKYYEAHQMYRTLYFRYMSQKKHAEAIELLYSGATLLLEHEQYGSGADLSILLAEVFQTSKAAVEDENIEKVAKLFQLIPQQIPERQTFLANSLRWAQQMKPPQTYISEIHRHVGIVLWKEKNFSGATHHLLRSNDGDSCGAMLVESHTQRGLASEVDLFVAQTVLQFLCFNNKSTASVTFYAYTANHPAIMSGPPFVLPLLNFLWLLLIAVDSGKLTVFTVLCEVYHPSLQRDPSYNVYLDKIGQVFFGVTPPPEPNGPPGMLGSLMRSFMGVEEESPEEPPPLTTEEVD
ncbi:putative Golgi to ER traffic protein 4-like B [Apostichopus japonicus]|uniref:Putative Golgi to ER traffic protein 4-like B n=1 Tax=Stichopus japonicus TaxID=307972 RepID=A0A2G8JMV0_STIJA|nr:putative Golgi to ER traffic protein 4-like B [Apostichopus japonicus]